MAKNTVILPLFFGLLALTAFFNIAEMALITARASRLKCAENSKAANQVLAVKKGPGLFVAAIRAGDLVHGAIETFRLTPKFVQKSTTHKEMENLK